MLTKQHCLVSQSFVRCSYISTIHLTNIHNPFPKGVIPLSSSNFYKHIRFLLDLTVIDYDYPCPLPGQHRLKPCCCTELDMECLTKPNWFCIFFKSWDLLSLALYLFNGYDNAQSCQGMAQRTRLFGWLCNSRD